MPKKYTKKEIDTTINNIGREFPLYPPRDGEMLEIELLDQTLSIITKDEEDFLGNVDGKWDNVQVHVVNLNTNKDRVFTTRIFNDVPGLIFKVARENGHDPLKMRGLQFRLEGLPDYKCDVELIGEASEEDKPHEASTQDIKDAIKEFRDEREYTDEELLEVVPSYLEASEKRTTKTKIQEVLRGE